MSTLADSCQAPVTQHKHFPITGTPALGHLPWDTCPGTPALGHLPWDNVSPHPRTFHVRSYLNKNTGPLHCLLPLVGWR
ncbi:hypothetical protein ACOMHN_009070 [Nucella lapillus]